MVTEKKKKLNISGEYDVVVVGGGIAGVSASLASARQGKRTLLIESQYMLGGLATAGLITFYLPLCDGKGHQLSFGIAEELLKLSISCGAEENCPKAWIDNSDIKEKSKSRYRCQFNANVFSLLMEKLLLKENVNLLFGTIVCETLLNSKKDKINYLVVENKSFRSAIKCKTVIDCSGDAVVCRLSNENFEIYKKSNGLAAWYYELLNGKTNLQMLGLSDTSASYVPIGTIEGNGAETVNLATIKAHSIILENFLSKGELSRTHSIETIPTVPQIRMTYRVKGITTLEKKSDRTFVSSSIGMFGSWRENGPAFELPLETLYGEKIKNLYVAGRCISASEEMWDLTRVIPVCAVSGEACGVAAANYKDNKKINIYALQKKLKSSGVRLHLDEVQLEYKNK